jgi:taurine dioxygenase
VETANVVIRPLSPFGAEVTGVDLSEDLPGDIKRRLHEAWLKHSLLLFPDQELTREQQLEVVTIFGKVTDRASISGPAPGGVNFVTNVYERGIGVDGEMNLNVAGELRFHLDHTFYDDPLRGITLYAIEVPPPGKGGDTLFSDMRLAFDLLPVALRNRIAGLKARYKVPHEGDPQSAVHPLVFKHPESGETLLFLSRRHADHILDVSPEEGEALMDELSAYIERPEIIYRHQWKPKDLVVWDNLALQHARDDFDPSYHRHLRRTQIG